MRENKINAESLVSSVRCRRRRRRRRCFRQVSSFYWRLKCHFDIPFYYVFRANWFSHGGREGGVLDFAVVRNCQMMNM